MSTEEQHQDVADDTSDFIQIPVTEVMAALWQRRRWLAAVTGTGMLVAIGISLLLPNEYTSTAQLMPPDQQSVSSASMLSALTGVGAMIPGGASGLLNTRTPGSTVIGILSSRTAQDDIINRFDLRRIYHCKLYVDAQKTLEKHALMEEDKKTGIISIAVADQDRNRARDIAEAYIEELNKILNEENTSSAHRERVFLEDRLKSIKSDLDASSSKLSQFSSRNATINPQTQGQALMEAASKLQGELITAQSELYGLKAQYSDDNVRVRAVQARIDELQSQLRKMGGIGEKENGADLNANQLYPSIRELPILGATYSDLYRQLMMQETIYETLTKQYELAKVQEAKEIPTIKVLDEPELPEKKSFPHRSVFAMVGLLVSAFAGFTWVIVRTLWEISGDANPVKMFGASIMSPIRVDNSTKAK